MNNNDMVMKYDFKQFKDVEVLNINLEELSEDKLEVLFRQAKYCQAMCDADIDTLEEIVSRDSTFTHMSGKTQTRNEYFNDIKTGKLDYYSIGIDSPIIEVNNDTATIAYTSVLYANAYGATGTYRITGTHAFVKINNEWISLNR